MSSTKFDALRQVFEPRDELVDLEQVRESLLVVMRSDQSVCDQRIS